MPAKINLPSIVILVLAVSTGYSVARLTGAPVIASESFCEYLSTSVDDLYQHSVTLEARLKSLQDNINRMSTVDTGQVSMPRAEPRDFSTDAEVRTLTPAAGRDHDQPEIFNAETDTQIKKNIVDAFVSGVSIQSIMTSDDFSKLSAIDQELLISEMVQLVNDGLVSDDLIYGSGARY